MSNIVSVTLDASFVIGYCAREPDKYFKAQTELIRRIANGSPIHAPHLLIMEVTYVLCGKRKKDELTHAEHSAAIFSLRLLSKDLIFPANGDVALLDRAAEIQQNYGCSHSADCFYIALAEQLALKGSSELITFDAGQQRKAEAVGSEISVTMLTT